LGVLKDSGLSTSPDFEAQVRILRKVAFAAVNTDFVRSYD
jgi:hypothetical protein